MDGSTVLAYVYHRVDDTWSTYARDTEPVRWGWMKAWVWRRLPLRPIAFLDPDLFKKVCESEKHEVPGPLELSDLIVTDACHPEAKNAVVIKLPNGYWAGYGGPPEQGASKLRTTQNSADNMATKPHIVNPSE